MTQAKKYYNATIPYTDDFAASLNIYQGSHSYSFKKVLHFSSTKYNI